MNSSRKELIFLGLTKLHRDLKNNGNRMTISFHKLFKDYGIKSPNEVIAFRDAMLEMKIILKHKDGTYSWNREMTLPNPLLIDGIYTTIKKRREVNKIKVTTKKPVLSIYINGDKLQSSSISISCLY